MLRRYREDTKTGIGDREFTKKGIYKEGDESVSGLSRPMHKVPDL